MLLHLFVLRLLHTECAWATTLATWSQRAPLDVTSALQQPHAVAPPGDGKTDDAEWGIVPPLGIGNASNVHISQVPVGQSGMPIQAIIRKKKAEGVKLCVTTAGYLRGGLANSMGVINIAMDYAIKNNLRFVMPQILPIDHDLGDDFAFMFGSNPVCATRTVSVWPASCPPSSLMGKRPPVSELPKHDGCNITQQLVHETYKDTTSACRCDEFLLVGTSNMTWSYDYSRTGAVFSMMYWGSAPGGRRSHSTALKFPLRTVMHVRLGDVEGKGDSVKALTGEDYAELTMAFTSFIDAACLDVSILTDGDANNENILAPVNAWTEAGASNTQVLDITTPAKVSFDTMARADILIGGPSGFPRLAAVLGDAHVKFFIDDFGNSHPIQYLPGVSEFGPDDIKATSFKMAAHKALRQNDRVAEVAAACTKWQRR